MKDDYSVFEGHYDDAEQSVIGAVLTDNSLYPLVRSLKPEEFADEVHGDYWSIISREINAGHPVDAVLIADIMGPEHECYLNDLVYHLASTRNVGSYAAAVRKAAQKRALRKFSEHLCEELAAASADVPEIARQAQEKLAAQTPVDEAQSDSFADAVDETLASMEREIDQPSGVTTTIPWLNHHLGSFSGSRLYVLGGRPGHYKSVFAWQVAQAAGIEGKPVGFVSLEMGRQELIQRAFAREFDVDMGELRDPSRALLSRLRAFELDDFRNRPIYLDCHSKTFTEIEAKVKDWKSCHGIEIAIIDYLQLMKTAKTESRFAELAVISRGLKALSMDLNMPILALAQLSREVERQKRRPALYDLRESGNIEQDADVVLFLYSESKKDDKKRYWLHLAKNRNGPAHIDVELVPDGRHARIGERSPFK